MSQLSRLSGMRSSSAAAAPVAAGGVRSSLLHSTTSSEGEGIMLDLVARDFEQNVPVRNNRYHFKVYRDTFVGREAVDYLVLTGYVFTREEAVQLGRELCEQFNLFEHVCRDHEFKDAFLFYRFIDPSLRKNQRGSGEISNTGSSSTNKQQDPGSETTTTSSPVADLPVEKLQQIVTKLQTNLVVKDRKYRLKKYSRCFVASEAVDFLVGSSEIVDRRTDAVKLGLRLQKELGAFHHVRYEHDFADDHHLFQWKTTERSKSDNLVPSRSPQAVLDFWFGPLRQAADMNEENWRDRMSQWRIGIFVRGESADKSFLRYQKEWCDELVNHESLLDGWENEPMGALAKLLILDQFFRSHYRGTPIAFSKQPEIAAITQKIFINGWDLKNYTIVERMWVYMTLTQLEDKEVQDLSINKWTKWHNDMLAMSSKENVEVNRKVSLNILKRAVEHMETILWHGRYPHRNAVRNRPNTYAELQYLLSSECPIWTKSQPVDPEFQALHALIHQIAPGEGCNELSRSAIVRFDEFFGLDGELIPVLFRGGKKSIRFEDLYKHLRQSSKQTTLHEIRTSKRMIRAEQQICQIVYQDEITIWPPIFSEVPLVVDIRRLNAYIGCPFLVDPAKFSISRSAIRDFQSQTGFQPEQIAKLYGRHVKRIEKGAAAKRLSSTSIHGEAVLDKDHFRAVFSSMFSRNLDATLDQIYNLIDTGHNKVLDPSELYVAMIIFGSGSVQEKAKLTVAYFDTDGDGRLNAEDVNNLIEACFLSCPAFLSTLFEGYGAGLASDDSDDEDGRPVTVRNIQTLRKAYDLGAKILTEVDADNDELIESDALVAWLQSKSDAEASENNAVEAKKLFLELFGVNDVLFFDEL